MINFTTSAPRAALCLRHYSILAWFRVAGSGIFHSHHSRNRALLMARGGLGIGRQTRLLRDFLLCTDCDARYAMPSE